MTRISNVTVIDDLSSDHFPITFSISCGINIPSQSKILNLHKADWKKFRLELTLRTPELIAESSSLENENDIDNCIDKFSSSIHHAIDTAIPKKNPFKFRYKFSNEIKKLIQLRNSHRKQYKIFLRASDRSVVNILNRWIRSKTSELNKQNYENKLSQLTTNDNSIWSYTKTLKRKTQSIPPIKCQNGNLVFTDKDKADTLATFFNNAHQLTVNETSVHDRNVKLSTKKVSQSMISEEVQHTSALKIKRMIESLNSKKAPGLDKISNHTLKKLPSHSMNILANIFNKCIDLSYFPSVWKVAKVFPILKPGKDPSKPSSFRPISLLSSIGKLFESILLNQLCEHEERNSLIINQQFGFVKGHSTVHQVLRITEKAAINFNKNISTGLVLLDLEKAFDSVWHDGLIHRLLEYKYPIYLIKLIQSYLKKRRAFVELRGAASNDFVLKAGVPQGSILSPHLFNIFVNPIPTPSNCEIAMYADDTAIMCEVPSQDFKTVAKTLQQALAKVSKFFKTWKIRLNSEKTEFIVLTKSSKMIRNLSKVKPVVGNATLEWKKSVRYLGVILDQKLLFKDHIDMIIHRAKALAFKTLYCLLNRRSALPLETKIAVYRSIIRPTMTYACQVFNNCAFSHFNKIQTTQNKLLRMIFNADWFTTNVALHNAANIPFIRNFVDKLTNDFYCRTASHKNNLINSLGKYTEAPLGFRLKHHLPRLVNS